MKPDGLQQSDAKRSAVARGFDVIGVVALLLFIWWVSVALFQPPAFLFPSPFAVFTAFFNNSHYFLHHGFVTLTEIVLGLFAGAIVGFLTAILMTLWWPIERLLSPIMAISQALPVFAIAPLLVLWVGLGLGSKIIMAALIIYFPVASSLHEGMKRCPRGYHELAHLYRARLWQRIVFLQLPAALPSLSTGIKMAATLAPIGAIVGEWVGSAAGLGHIMLHANARMQTADMFVALFLLAMMAILSRALTGLLLDRFIPWSTSS